MKEADRREVFEEYEKLKMEVADGTYFCIGYIIRLLYKNKIGNTQYWIDKLCKIFSQKLDEKDWDAAYTLACTELGAPLPDDVEIFKLTGNSDKRNELRKRLAEALEKELQSGNGSIRKELSDAYLQLEEIDNAKRVWQQPVEEGNPIAQYELGQIYYYREKNKKAAYELFKKSANAGCEAAKRFLASWFSEPPVPNDERISVGSFWGIPDKAIGKQVIAGIGTDVKLLIGNKEIKGEIRPRSHWDVYKHARSPHSRALENTLLSGEDTFDLYPKFSISYDADNKRHIISADECIKQECIDEAVSILNIKNYMVRHCNEYVCPNCRHKYPPIELEYNVLRGHDKIGANLIEISYGRTKILVELGKSLEGGDEQLEQSILDKPYSAVVVSHYHEDHAGLIKSKQDCPVYMGQGTYRIIKAMGDYRDEEMPENIEEYYNGKSFRVDGIKITPFLCDHSAYDSYMLLFEAGGKSILYTGDFRFHGRKDKEKLLSALPKSVDVLIHEGTNIGKRSCTMTEAELENKAVEIMKATDMPVFVLQSGTNIDRLVSIYRASKRSGRITYMDNYTSLIAQAAGGGIPRPDVFRDVIAFTPRAVHGKREEAFMEIINKRGIKGIANGTKRFTMLVRPSMLDYIKKLHSTADISGATLIYSMWKGYKETDYTADFLKGVQELGMNIIDLHISGHASTEDIELLKQTVNPKETICVHTEMPD